VVEIEPLDAGDSAVARQILALLRLAHDQEARLLQVPPGAPPDRFAHDVPSRDTFFLGARSGADLVGALSLSADDEPDQVRIATLAVHPAHQRRGIARTLLSEALRRGAGFAFTVATPVANAPALALYQAFGFVVYRRGVIGTESIPLVKLRRAGAPGQPPACGRGLA
jgi:ribosomal protein S18 acetylase RimI-like enzyme